MSVTLDLFTKRALGEEGKKQFAYNDATGKRVTCQPGGNLSIGVGLNLETGLEDEEIVWLFRNRAGKMEQQLQAYAWYVALDAVRQSVVLDIAFNNGLHGLLHFPAMIAALTARNWAEAAKQCTVTNPALAGRYAALADLLLRGTSP